MAASLAILVMSACAIIARIMATSSYEINLLTKHNHLRSILFWKEPLSFWYILSSRWGGNLDKSIRIGLKHGCLAE